jgi:hypothetical protein
MIGTVDCQQLKRTSVKSAGHSVACNDLILTACARDLPWGDMAHYKVDMGREMAATGLVARIWEELSYD